MIQFNLLPDIKLKYIKAKRQEHIVIFISTIAIIVAVTISVILISIVDVVQKKELSDAKAAVSSDVSQLRSTPNLQQILTVQNQMQALPNLHNAKPAVSRLFNYLTELTPSSATISKLTVDYTQNTVNISGSANNLATVNQFTDTLKFTGYSIKGQSGSKPAFSGVVLSDFSDSSASGATYTITASFDPTIFEYSQNINITVPGIINTRSEEAQPDVLFVQTGS